MVGTATLGGNGTIASLTLTGVAAGTHTYTAQYPGDSTYAAYSFGSVTVTVSPLFVCYDCRARCLAFAGSGRLKYDVDGDGDGNPIECCSDRRR